MRSQDGATRAISIEIGRKDLVRRSICSRIISGVYRQGEKIPSCRDIANQLQVSKNSAYEAYSDLVGIGILEMIPETVSFKILHTTLHQQGPLILPLQLLLC